MLKIVPDTNIFISSIFWELGNPHKVIKLALDGKIKIYTSIEILQELEKILKRDFNEPVNIVNEQIGLILEISEIVEPAEKLNIIKEDPEDNKILECAISSKADYIITGDKHLLDMKEFCGVKIVNAKQFLDIYLLFKPPSKN